MTDDEKLAELRRKAYAAFADHERDMEADPEYRKEAEKFIKAEDRRIKRNMGL